MCAHAPVCTSVGWAMARTPKTESMSSSKKSLTTSIDEFKMQAGKKIEITVEENLRVSVRDYGRGIPQGKLVEAVSVLNTGGKYDSKAFKKSVGLNGVGVKAVNALSSRFEVRSYRDGKVRIATFSKETCRPT